MVGQNRSRWNVCVAFAVCGSIPLLAISLLMIVANFAAVPTGKSGVKGATTTTARQAIHGFDRTRSGTPPVTIKINHWTDVLRTFYFDVFYPPKVPNVEPVFPGVRIDDGSMKPL